MRSFVLECGSAAKRHAWLYLGLISLLSEALVRAADGGVLEADVLGTCDATSLMQMSAGTRRSDAFLPAHVDMSASMARASQATSMLAQDAAVFSHGLRALQTMATQSRPIADSAWQMPAAQAAAFAPQLEPTQNWLYSAGQWGRRDVPAEVAVAPPVADQALQIPAVDAQPAQVVTPAWALPVQQAVPLSVQQAAVQPSPVQPSVQQVQAAQPVYQPQPVVGPAPVQQGLPANPLTQAVQVQPVPAQTIPAQPIQAIPTQPVVLTTNSTNGTNSTNSTGNCEHGGNCKAICGPMIAVWTFGYHLGLFWGMVVWMIVIASPFLVYFFCMRRVAR